MSHEEAEHNVLLAVDSQLRAIVSGGTPIYARAAANIRRRVWVANLVSATTGGPAKPQPVQPRR